MPDGIAITTFDHDRGRYREGDLLPGLSDRIATQMVRKRLIRLTDAPPVGNPQSPVGAKSSASPAGQASQQTIAILSAAGAALAAMPVKRKPGRPRKNAV